MWRQALHLTTRQTLAVLCSTLLLFGSASTLCFADDEGSTSSSSPSNSDTADIIQSTLSSVTVDSSASSAANNLLDETRSFYEARHFRPAWSGSEGALERARHVRFVLEHAYEQGLPNDYAANLNTAGSVKSATDAAAYDIAMTTNLMRYTHDVRTGRIDPAQVYSDVGLIPQSFDAPEALKEALHDNTIDDFLADLPPPHPEYRRLVAALAKYRSGASPVRRVQQIAANMERWRWLPRELERRYIAVNVPDQSLEFIRNGQSVLKSKVIIGRQNSRTPILAMSANAVIANPSWEIPDDIAARMQLPQLQKDPGGLATRNIVFEDGQYRQNPGPDNGLGLVMLDTPNNFWVYLHDTPKKKLFSLDTREISNGCVRVQQIFSLASLALTDDPNAGLESLKEAIDTGETQRIPLSNPLPVYLLYWTVRAYDDGTIEFLPDRYGRDAPLIERLGVGLSAPSGSRKGRSPSVHPRHKPTPAQNLASRQ